MRHLQIVAGLLLIPLFAVAVLAALMMTYTLVKDGIGSGGDPADFEALLRHYSDRLEVRPDGSWVLHKAPHPVASFLAFFVGSWAVATLLGYVLERLRRRVHL
jgi:hypothetical protein